MKLKQVTLENGGFHYVAKCIIDDIPALMLIDTGASETVMCTDWIAANKLQSRLTPIERNLITGSKAQDKKQVMNLNLISNRMKCGDLTLTIKYPTISVMPLRHISEYHKQLGGRGIDGILGMNIMVEQELKLDLGKAMLIK